jgi:Sulfotransferase domain
VGEALSETGVRPASADAAQGKPLLAFVHIPRTGGGTVSTAIARNYSPRKDIGNFQRDPERARQGLANVVSKDAWKAVGGHTPFGLFRRYLSADTRYITVLRDPVDRVLSHYHFHAQAGDPPGSLGPRKLRNTWETLLNHERLERAGGDQEDEILLENVAEFTLEEGLRRKICIYDNFMTRFLWGGESLFGELPPEALERAKENISNFWFVGVRERLDESIILLGRKLGVGLMPYYLRHVSQKRPPLDETSDELRALIADHNTLDVELYRFARERFEAEAPPPGELDPEVEELRARSIEVTEAAAEARSARKEAGKTQRRERKTERRRAAKAPAELLPADGDVQQTLEFLNQRIDRLAKQVADLESRLARGGGGEVARPKRARRNVSETPEQAGHNGF